MFLEPWEKSAAVYARVFGSLVPAQFEGRKAWTETNPGSSGTPWWQFCFCPPAPKQSRWGGPIAGTVPAFIMSAGAKMAAALDPMRGHLFVTRESGFTKRFLDYHEQLHFHGSLSTRPMSRAQAAVLLGNPSEGSLAKWRMLYQDARFLRMAMIVAEQIGGAHLRHIVIGDELSGALLTDYDRYQYEVQGLVWQLKKRPAMWKRPAGYPCTRQVQKKPAGAEQ